MRVGMRISSTLVVCAWLTAAGHTAPLLHPNDATHTPQDATNMVRAAAGILAPVYGPLAEHIVEEFQLAQKQGIGIDVGSGPGTLIIELAKRTRMHWINADINPHFFPGFLERADEAGIAGRVSAVFADAQALPFRDNYADVIVSRGSFQFWKDKRLAFSELYRVLKPGGIAFIGRGFSENLPVDTAHQIRAAQKKEDREDSVLKYSVAETESELRDIMASLGVESYGIHIPKPSGSEGINYGLWIEIRKKAVPTADGEQLSRH
jgi:SAM-dependent methyltransferase